MIICLWHLMKCDTVVFMDNWQDSRGARIEHRAARFFDKQIIYVHDDLANADNDDIDG